MAERKFKSEADRLLSLQREYPIEFWLRRAHERALQLNLPVESLGKAIGIVTGAVSELWVRERVAKHRKGIIGVFHANPLVKAFAVAGDNDLVTVVELAIYLKHLYKVEGLQDVISFLRADNTFDSALLQFACAYRLQKMGARIRLEPAALGGQRGDIHLAWEEKEYMVECYIPRAETDQQPLKDVIAFALGKMMNAASTAGKVVRVLIKFSTYPDAPQRLELEKATIRLVGDVPVGGNVTSAVGCADVEVQEIAGQPDADFLEDGTPNENGPYFSSSTGIMGESFDDVETIRPLGWSSPSMQNGSRVIWWRPPHAGRTIEDRILDLSDRIGKKLAQTRAEGGTAKRIMIAQIPEVQGRDRIGRKITQGVQRRLIPRHEGIAGIILTSRVWTHEHRFRYHALLARSRDRDEIIDEIYRKVGKIDFDFDLLHDWD